MTQPGGSDSQPDQRRAPQIIAGPRPLPEHDVYARDHAFKRSIGFSIREGVLWDEAWAAARSYYLARVGDEPDTRQ